MKRKVRSGSSRSNEGFESRDPLSPSSSRNASASSRRLAERLLSSEDAYREVARDLFRSLDTDTARELVDLEIHASDPILRSRASMALSRYVLLLFEKILVENKPDQVNSIVRQAIGSPEKVVPILAALISEYVGPIDGAIYLEDPVQAEAVKLGALRVLLRVVGQVDISEAFEALQSASSSDPSTRVMSLADDVLTRARRTTPSSS